MLGTTAISAFTAAQTPTASAECTKGESPPFHELNGVQKTAENWTIHRDWLFPEDGLGYRLWQSAGNDSCHMCVVNLAFERIQLEPEQAWAHERWYPNLNQQAGAWDRAPEVELHRTQAVDVLVVTNGYLGHGQLDQTIQLFDLDHPSTPALTAHAVVRAESTFERDLLPDPLLDQLNTLECSTRASRLFGARSAKLELSVDSISSSFSFRFADGEILIEPPCSVTGVEFIKAKGCHPHEHIVVTWPFENTRLEWDVRELEADHPFD